MRTTRLRPATAIVVFVYVACSDRTPEQADASTVLQCDDGNPCTTDSETPAGCLHVQAGEGEPCAGGIGGICDDAGICRP